MSIYAQRASAVPMLWVAAFLLAAASSLLGVDCNLNGVEDLNDIAAGASEDCNSSGVPDECESAPLSFNALVDALPLSDTPRTVMAADLDADGVEDLIVGNRDAGNVSSLSIFLSRENDGVPSELHLEAGTRLSDVIAVDLDADEDLDILTVNSTVLLKFENQGHGSFAAPSEIAVPRGTRSVVAIDLTGEGQLVLVTTNATAGTVAWQVQRDDGSFGDVVEMEVGVRPIAVVPVDFDADGDLDLAVANVDSETISLLRNSGGRFEIAESLPAPRRMQALHGGDFNGDGRLDLVAAADGATFVWLTKTAGFGEPTAYPVSAGGLDIADFDGDGRLDLAVGTLDRTTVAVLLQADDGELLAPRNFGVELVTLVAADLDGDGDVDLACPALEPPRVTLLSNEEGGRFVFELSRHRASGEPHGVVARDFNGDGFLDVVSANSDDLNFAVFFGGGDGTFEPAVVHPSGRAFASVVSADFDGDATLDVAFPQESLVVYYNTDGGAFTNRAEFPGSAESRFSLSTDLDGDTHSDVIVPNPVTEELILHFNDGRGGFPEPVLLNLGRTTVEVAAVDFDADGDMDLITVHGGAAEVALVSQLEPRRFSVRRIPVDGSSRGITTADFDVDGDADFATVGQFEVATFLNGGDGSFRPSGRFDIERPSNGVLAVDLDADGIPDLVTTSETGDSISTRRGLGGGTFGAGHPLAGTTGPRRTTTADLDGDGDSDLVVANRLGFDIAVFLNQLERRGSLVDFLGAVCTRLDFHTVSAPLGSPSGGRRTMYLVPAGRDPALLGTLFQNVNRFAVQQRFLEEVFPDRFGDLGEESYAALVGRRETREYFGGGVRRLQLEGEGTIFGVDLFTDPPELPSQEEVRAVIESLAGAFALGSLVYLPQTPAAREDAASWVEPGFRIVFTPEEKEPEEPLSNPTFLLEIEPDTVLCGSFWEAGASRGPREEYELKSHVRFRGGTVTLPTARESFSADLFEEVWIGRERSLAEPLGDGAFRVVRIPPIDGIATYRFTYAQAFRLPDGRRLDLEIVEPLVYRARGENPVEASGGLGERFFVALKGRESLQARIDGVPLVRYGSCTYQTLGRWRVEADLADGTQLRLEERFDEAASRFNTAPAILARAEVALGETRRVVTDSFELVYSASRHNREIVYWVVLEPPQQLAGVGVVSVVELQAPDERLRPQPRAAYLGADLDVLATLPVTRFERRPFEDFRFRRGDGNGDSRLDILDALKVLDHLFRRGTLPCRKAADANDDGGVNLVDVVATISLLFQNGEPLPEPRRCGFDPTADALECAEDGCVTDED